MSFVNSLCIRLFCKKVGTDVFGNRYFLGRKKNYLGQNKRYVIYNGSDQSSKVPPLWHAWLHYSADEIPTTSSNYEWQQEYLPNLTGTRYAYSPKEDAQKFDVYTQWEPK